MQRPVAHRYTRTAMALHWAMAALLVANVILGLGSESLPDGWVRTGIDTHKSLGITLLGLVVVRILWRLANPPPPVTGTSGTRLAAGAAHAVLYALMLAIPLSGWLHDSAWKDAATHPMHLFGLFQWPRIGPVMALDPATRETLHAALGTWHAGLSYGLYALVALHVAAALKHHFRDRDATLARMLPGRGL